MLGKLVEMRGRGEVDLRVPIVVLMEYWAGKEMDEEVMVEKAEKMFSGFSRIDLTEESAKKAGELLRHGFTMETVDAMVAACAFEIGAEVATRNMKHFAKVPGLKLFRG